MALGHRIEAYVVAHGHLARISEDERLIFKQEWIESLDELFQGFLNAQDVMEDESNTCWECIVCSKEQD